METEKTQAQRELDNFFIKTVPGGTNSATNENNSMGLNDESMKLPPVSSSKDRLFVLIALLLGFLLFEFILFGGFGISVPVYMTVFYAAVFWYFYGKPSGISRSGLPLLVPIALLSACFGLYDNPVLAVLNFMLLSGLVAFQLAAMSGNRLYKSFSLGLVIDLFHTGVALPLVNIPAPFRALKRKPEASGKANKAGAIAIGLAISVPILAVVLVLLSSADAVFEKAVNSIFKFLGENVMSYIGKLILGIIVAIPLFGLLYALRNNRKISSMKRNINFERIRFIDENIVSTVLVLINVVYLAFIAVQFGYLLNAFSSILPAGFGYASYARRGFFELMGIVCINLCLLSASHLFSKHSARRTTMLLKVLETMLVVLTLFLIASAFSKMAMYVDAYGLTLLRVYTSWFMLLCAVVFIAFLVKIHVKKFALTRFCSIAFLALFLALNFTDVDARIPQYNISRYTSGVSKTVDVEQFYNLSDSMIPYVATLLDKGDSKTAAKALELLADRAAIVDDMRWQAFSVSKENARRTLIGRGISYIPRTYETFEGSDRTND